MGFNHSSEFVPLIQAIDLLDDDVAETRIFFALVEALENLDFDVWDELEGLAPTLDAIIASRIYVDEWEDETEIDW